MQAFWVPSPFWGVTFLRYGVFILGALHCWQVVLLGQQMAILSSLPNTVSPVLRLIFGLLWTIVWLALWISLLSKPLAVRWWVVGALVVYVVYQHVLILMAASEVSRSGWPVTAIVGICLIGFASWVSLKLSPAPDVTSRSR